MGFEQRYVSRELTHFVGRASKDKPEECYQLLLKILRGGWLTHPPHVAGPSNPKEVDIDASPTADDLVSMKFAVCFCDIPVADLALHMSKYSRFGLSFTRAFLHSKGANPVFYIPKHTVTWEGDGAENMSTFRVYLNAWASRFGERADRGDQLSHGEQLFFRRVMPYMKLYDETLAEDDPKNYYFERELRVRGNVPFTLADIERIILPREFAARFRVDVPDFVGQLTFAD